MPKLTKKVVEALEPKAVDYFAWCDDLPNFGVRVFPSGKRTYLVQYRAEGRSRRASIGLHGHVTVEEARKQAQALLGQVAKGGNPAEERKTQREAMTVRELCDRYMTAAQSGAPLGKGQKPKKPLTQTYDAGRISGHIVPLLGNRRVADLRQADIARFAEAVRAGKTAKVAKTAALRGKSIVKGGPTAAARTLGLLGGILSWAVEQGVISANPAAGVRRPPDKARTGRLTPEQYAALGRALHDLNGEGFAEAALNIVRLLLLTGCRRGEVNGLVWREVDIEGRALRLEDTKEGRSARPLGKRAVELLEAMEKIQGTDWVFPSEREPLIPYGGMKGAWPRIAARAGLSGVSLHTLRHSFASVAADLGYSESTIAALLGHAAGSVTGRYTHHLDAVLLAAADAVAGKVAEMVEAEAAPPVAPA